MVSSGHNCKGTGHVTFLRSLLMHRLTGGTAVLKSNNERVVRGPICLDDMLSAFSIRHIESHMTSNALWTKSISFQLHPTHALTERCDLRNMMASVPRIQRGIPFERHQANLGMAERAFPILGRERSQQQHPAAM
jgi:hypothetical protein